MNTVPFDRDLDFLKQCTKDELDPLVTILLNASTNYLEIQDDYKLYKPDHTKYVDSIIADYQTFGGNTFANTFRGHGVPYWEILKDVCDNQKVSTGDEKLETMEVNLIEKSLKGMWESLDENQRKQIISEIGGSSFQFGGVSTEALLAAFRLGGFTSYKLILILMNGLAKIVIGRGLSFGANMALARALSIVTGPIGWTIGGLWTALDIGSPAYRVTVPATIYIAALRKMKREAKVMEAACLGLNRGGSSFPSCSAKEDVVTDGGNGSKNVMLVLIRAGRNEYEVKEWLMRNMYVGFPLATQLVQKRSVLKTSMPYAEAMRWKHELEALGATVEVS